MAAAIALTCSQSADAAVRTVQFTGLMGADFTVGAVGNEAGVAYCSVAIVNTGRQPQRIVDIEMLPYFQGNQRMQGFTNSGILFTIRSAAEPVNTTCVGQDLVEGAVCIARMAGSTILVDGRYMVCAGRITVEDLDGNPPGSVSAAGTITINQEAVLLGGVMSGAFYQSGSHILDGENLDQMHNPTTHNIFSTASPGQTHVQAMNIYCARACLTTAGTMNNPPLTRVQCEELCGFGHNAGMARDITDPNRREWRSNFGGVAGYWNAIGLITEAGSFAGKPWCANGDGGGTDPNGGACNPPDPQTPSPPSNSWPRSSRKLAIKTANSHFAGGMVYEMNMGPMNMICSANRSFWNAGGNEMLHPDGVDDHAIVFGENTSYPPERLFCGHRHAEDDLHMRVGSSSSFTINGGNPF